MSMKYDAGMTQYHDDIVSALRDMLHGEIDKIAELAAEGSPVPLREYLRNNHGKKSHGGNKFDAMSSCFLVIFDHVINNEGDSKLDLSWSQVATFIRKYPSDFFKKNDDKEAFPCDDCGYDKHGCCNYPDTPDDYCVMGNKKTSLDIDELDLDVRTFNAFKHAGINTVEDYLNCPDKDKLRSVVGNRNFEKFLAASKPAELPAAQSASDTSVFDYSELDSDTTKALKGCEAVIKQETSGYFTMLGSKFKEAQELLANHGKGTFERWYSSIGFKRQTVYNLIQRYEFSSSPTIGGHEEIFEALPVTLSYEISKPTAPPKLVDKVLSGDITSNSEYKKELEQIQEEARKAKERADEAEKKAAFWSKTSAETSKENQQLRADRVSAMNRADNAERELSEAQAKIEKLNREADEADREYDAMADRECHYETEICELEHRVKELESRPVDVAVQTDDSLLKEKDQEISELKEQIERMSDKNVKSFVIRMSLDEYEQLIKALEQADDRLKNIIKNARILKI